MNLHLQPLIDAIIAPSAPQPKPSLPPPDDEVMIETIAPDIKAPLPVPLLAPPPINEEMIEVITPDVKLPPCRPVFRTWFPHY